MNSSDNIAILTSENIRLNYTLAGIGSRFVAILIDTVIIGIAGGIITLLFMTSGLALRDLSRFGESISLINSLYMISMLFLNWGYFFFFEWINWGQTPGKMIMGLRVSMADGAPVDITACAVRNLIRLVDFIFIGVTIFVLIFTPKYQRFGDLAAGTVVVRHRKLTFDDVMDFAKAADHSLSYPDSLNENYRDLSRLKLSSQEAELLEKFISRKKHLSPELRKKISKDLADRFRSRISGSPLCDLSDDDLIEQISLTIH